MSWDFLGFSPAYWEVHSTRIMNGKPFYNGETFTVYVPQDKAFIMENNTLVTEQLPSSFLEIPIEHLPDFENDLERALRDLAGIHI